MPGVFIAGLMTPTLAKSLFWLTVMIIQFFYYSGIAFIYLFIKKKVMKTRE